MKLIRGGTPWAGRKGRCEFCHGHFALTDKDRPIEHDGEHGKEYLMLCPKCKYGVVVCRKKTEQ